MNSSRLAIVCVSLLVLLAGCGGAANPSESATATAGGTTTATATTAPSSNAAFAPGTTSERITNTSTLMQSHVGTLTSQGFVVRQNQVFSLSSDRTAVARTIVQVDAEQKRFYFNRSVRGSTQAVYFQNGTLYVQTINQSGTFYQVQEAPDSFETYHQEFTGVGSVGRIAQVGTYARASNDTESSDTTRYRLTTLENESGNASGTGQLIVNRNGYVQYAYLNGSVDTPEGRQTVELEVTVEPTDSGLGRPSWVDEAEQQN